MITLAIIIIIGLPALLLISVCMAASRTTQREEIDIITAQAADASFAMKSGTKGGPRKTRREAFRTPSPFLKAVEK